MKRVAIYQITLDLVVQGLQAIKALPDDAVWQFEPGSPTLLAVRLRSGLLPEIPEGATVLPVRVAVEGDPAGLLKAGGDDQ